MIVFIHGLNTYGDDLLHVGPLTFGLMHARLEKAFHDLGREFLGMVKFGAGSPEDQADQIYTHLVSSRRLHSQTPITLLGQSTGGLVARVLATKPALTNRIKSVYTIGTPHEGTTAANFGLDFSQNYPRVHRLFAQLGYNTDTKSAIFRHYTPQAMLNFNMRYPALPHIPEYTLLCDAEGSQLSAPLRILQRRMRAAASGEGSESGFRDRGGEGSESSFGSGSGSASERSDGFISCASQTRGEVVDRFQLDHFGELGAFYQSTRAARANAASEFARMVNLIDARL